MARLLFSFISGLQGNLYTGIVTSSTLVLHGQHLWWLLITTKHDQEINIYAGQEHLQDSELRNRPSNLIIAREKVHADTASPPSLSHGVEHSGVEHKLQLSVIYKKSSSILTHI